MANKNVNTTWRLNSPMEKDMEQLKCPFTWSMDNITKEDELQYHINDDEELFPLLQLMRHVMSLYVNTKFEIESNEILKELEKCNDILVALKETDHPQISFEVVNYVLQSTQCFVFLKLNLQDDLKRVYSEIKKDWNMNNVERSTLKACRSICWSKYHRIGSSQAEKFIRGAIKENPKCELWHFILGKNLRRKRRDSSYTSVPSGPEIRSFEKAYKMSANPVFGVFLAQMYREMKRMRKAEAIYNEIFQQNPTGTTLLLRLALGFIRLKNYANAKVCLDKVEAVIPNHSMYLHYRGIYHFNQNDYKGAMKFLKEASKDYNLPAEKQYLDCLVTVDKSFDVVPFFHDMLKKYNHLPEDRQQPLLLDLALAYWLKRHDVENAIKYFSMAVEINPRAICLTKYYKSKALPIKDNEVYQLLNRDILPIVRRDKEKFEQSCIDEVEVLQRHCHEYFGKKLAKTLNSFSNINIRN